MSSLGKGPQKQPALALLANVGRGWVAWYPPSRFPYCESRHYRETHGQSGSEEHSEVHCGQTCLPRNRHLCTICAEAGGDRVHGDSITEFHLLPQSRAVAMPSITGSFTCPTEQSLRQVEDEGLIFPLSAAYLQARMRAALCHQTRTTCMLSPAVSSPSKIDSQPAGSVCCSDTICK